MNQNDKYFKSYFNVPKKLVYSNITGTTPADFGIDTTRLERLKAELTALETEKLPYWESYLAQHEIYLAENIERARLGFFDPQNVVIERDRVANAKDQIKKLKEVEIPNKKAEIKDEQNLINSQLDKAIAALREKAKTDPAALAALKELEAQQAAISGSKTKWIIFGAAGLVVLVIVGIIIVRKIRKSKAGA